MVDLTQLDIASLQAGVADQQFTYVDIMTAFLDRIDIINPDLNAIISLRPREELLAEAKLADEKKVKSPLHGLPIAIKDLVETKGLRSTHGSPIFENLVPKKDDLLAERIRDSGSIIIGKTNTPEFGLGSQSYNGVHGVTRNPYDLSKTAGGSSGGAAAALAARLIPMADGSDMMGSLRNPAAYCNVYGLRPTYGLVPANPGKETFLHQLATLGPMGRTVKDLALLLDEIAGPDHRDPHALPTQSSFVKAIETPPSEMRIGWIGDWNGYLPMESGVLALCDNGIDVLKSAGHTVDPIVPDFDPKRIWESWIHLRSFVVGCGMEVFYSDPGHQKLLKPEAIYEIEQGLALSVTQIAAASLIRSQWFATMAEMFKIYDAVILPSAQVFPFGADTHWPQEVAGKKMETYHQWMEVVVPASLIGLPALNVPVGFSDEKLPMGMQIIGPRGSDAQLLKLGHAYHLATNWPDAEPTVFDS